MNLFISYLRFQVAHVSVRFPTSLPFVAIDFLERLYLACFPLLQIFVMVFPLLTKRSLSVNDTSAHADGTESGTSSLEFLPLMATSVYCAVGLVWAFVRLSVIYLARQD